MKKQNLWTILFAFLFGQLIQLVTVALAHYLYISDPVMVCIAVGIMTVAVVVISAIFTLMDQPQHPVNITRPGRNGAHSAVLPISYEKRPPLDTDPENIDEIDKNNAKENAHGII